MQVNTERSIRHAMQDRLPIVVVINKVHFYSDTVPYFVMFFLKNYCRRGWRHRKVEY